MNRFLKVGVTLMFLFATSSLSLAADGAALFKGKCAGCHGAGGEGKAGMKTPALKGTTLSADQIAEHLTKGEASSKAPHNKGMAGMTDEQAKAIADYVKSLK